MFTPTHILTKEVVNTFNERTHAPGTELQYYCSSVLPLNHWYKDKDGNFLLIGNDETEPCQQ